MSQRRRRQDRKGKEEVLLLTKQICARSSNPPREKVPTNIQSHFFLPPCTSHLSSFGSSSVSSDASILPLPPSLPLPFTAIRGRTYGDLLIPRTQHDCTHEGNPLPYAISNVRSHRDTCEHRRRPETRNLLMNAPIADRKREGEVQFKSGDDDLDQTPVTLLQGEQGRNGEEEDTLAPRRKKRPMPTPPQGGKRDG